MKWGAAPPLIAMTIASVACSSRVQATLTVAPCGYFVRLYLCVENKTNESIPEPWAALQVVGENGLVVSRPTTRVTLVGFIPAHASSCGPFGTWDLKDASGAPVAPGAYTISVVLDDGTESTRVTARVCQSGGVTTDACGACGSPSASTCDAELCFPPQ